MINFGPITDDSAILCMRGIATILRTSHTSHTKLAKIGEIVLAYESRIARQTKENFEKLAAMPDAYSVLDNLPIGQDG